MLARKFVIAVAASVAMTTVAAPAQNASTPPQSAAAPAPQVSAVVPDGGVPEYVRPETPEKRKERLGTAEDPGLDPDPNAHYWRFGKAYHISKFERRSAAYDTGEVGTVRPLGMVNFAFEIYQQNEKYVWCWMPDASESPTQQESPEKLAKSSRYSAEALKYFAVVRPQFDALTPPASAKTIHFVESSDGLPKSGSWRNSLAVADMNEDGCPDLVTPPERKGGGFPHIFLGDCKGHWREWTGVRWPHSLDYGGVAAADFNKDGHMDVVFAVHLNGVYVFLGDGKGNFTESSEGLPRDFPTRRVAVADVDGDGYPDIVAITEGPASGDLQVNASYGRLRAYLNRKKATAWEGINVADPNLYVGGDWLSVGHFNSDRYPDFIASSVYYGANQVAQLSDGPKKWKPLEADGYLLPANCYYLASAVGKFTRKRDEAIISYTRFWPTDLDERIVATPPLTEVTNVDRLVFTRDGMKRIPIMRWSGHAGVRGIATGDFDGDGNLDVIVTREESDNREAVILLGDGNGGFTRARVEGLTLDDNNIYDIKVADVNGDGLPDVILMYETLERKREDFRRMAVGSQTGSIKVFLNRGGKSAAQQVKPAK